MNMDEIAANEPDSSLLAAKTENKKEKELLKLEVNYYAALYLP